MFEVIRVRDLVSRLIVAVGVIINERVAMKARLTLW